MEPDELISRYVVEVAELLPARLRQDVALELRSLLTEELGAQAEAAGRPADAAMTLGLLRSFGHPTKVAARYHPRWSIVAPDDTRAFLGSAAVGGALLAAASVPARLLHPETAKEPTEAILLWLGFLVLVFGLKSWFARGSKRSRVWRPRRGDALYPGRWSSVALGVLAVVGIVAYGAPQWLFGAMPGGQHLLAWLAYDPTFRAERLPWLLVAWAGHAVLLGVAAWQDRWSPLLRRLNLLVSTLTLLLLAWFATAGPMLLQEIPDQTAHAYLRAILFLMTLDFAVRLYRVRHAPVVG